MKKIPKLCEILQKELDTIRKEHKHLQNLFMVYTEVPLAEIIKRYELEKDTLKKYDCKDSSEMITYIVGLEFLAQEIENEIYWKTR